MEKNWCIKTLKKILKLASYGLVLIKKEIGMSQLYDEVGKSKDFSNNCFFLLLDW